MQIKNMGIAVRALLLPLMYYSSLVLVFMIPVLFLITTLGENESTSLEIFGKPASHYSWIEIVFWSSIFEVGTLIVLFKTKSLLYQQGTEKLSRDDANR